MDFKHLIKALNILTIKVFFAVANKDQVMIVIDKNMVHSFLRLGLEG